MSRPACPSVPPPSVQMYCDAPAPTALGGAVYFLVFVASAVVSTFIVWWIA